MGILIDKPKEIAEIFVDHFPKTLNNYDGSNRVAQANMLEVIPKLVTVEDNKALNKLISLEEVRLVVFNMNPDKSPGADRFQAFFYEKCWDIIGKDLWEAIEASREDPCYPKLIIPFPL